jgi:hypothetical protein
MKKLTFKDAQTGATVLSIDVDYNENENYYFVADTSSPIFKTYEFMIECAIYGLNEGQTDFHYYEDDSLKPLAFWALTERAI